MPLVNFKLSYSNGCCMISKSRRFLEIQRNEGLPTAMRVAFNYISPFSSPTPSHLRTLDKRISEFELTDPKGVVLLPMIPGWYGTSGYRQAVLGHAFKIRGYKPVFLVNDAEFPICLGQMVEADNKQCKEECVQTPEQIAEYFNTDIEYLSSHLQRTQKEYYDIVDEQSVPNLVYKGHDLTPFITSSLRRHFKRYTLDFSKTDHKARWRDFAVDAMMLKDGTDSVLSKYDVKTIIGFEETYIQGGLPLSCGEREGITGYSIDWGYKPQDLLFGKTSNRQYLALFSDSKLLQNVVETELSASEIDAIEETMTQRMEGVNTKSDYVSFDHSSIDLEGYDIAVGLFTNLIWDASLEAKEGAYSDPFEWLQTTLDWFESQPNKLLIIKTHPAETLEGRHGTNQPVAEWIYGYCGQLPENVVLLEPDADVNPYEMISDIDVGIVYNSIIGLEMAYEGIPVIVAGDPHYRDLDFTYDATNPDDYTEYLEEISQGFDTSSTERLARRYAHYFFERKHIPVEFYESEGTYSRKKYPVTHDELAGEPYETIVQQMIEGESVYLT